MTETVTMLSGFALQGAIEPVLIPSFERSSGARVDANWNPTTLVVKALAMGEQADVVVLTDDAINDLARLGVIDSDAGTALANAVLGIAVLRGQPHPDISDSDAFQNTLLNCRAIAYSKAGASGIYFEKLIERLGIADQIRAKAVVIPAGLTAERLVSGDADIAIQQISELIMVDDAELVGPLPDEIACVTGFSAAVLKASKKPELAAKLVATLASPEAMQVYADAGLMPRR